MNTLDPKYQQKYKSISSPEQNYLSLFAMRYPVVMRRAAAAQGCLLICKIMGGQLPTMSTRYLRPC
jgi:hypothetical protein